MYLLLWLIHRKRARLNMGMKVAIYKQIHLLTPKIKIFVKVCSTTVKHQNKYTRKSVIPITIFSITNPATVEEICYVNN